MENKLEQLLNMLIQRGWEPFWKWKKRKVFARWDKTVSFSYQDDEWIEFYTYLIRDVVSKESWLWQFVCEKELIKSKWDSNYTYFNIHGTWKAYEHWNYEYRLIESALKDESELEDFLLDNIKV